MKNYMALAAPEMLWRFGLGPRPSNMPSAIQTVADLELNRPFVVFAAGAPEASVAKTSKDGSIAPPTVEEVEEVEEVEAGLLRKKSKRPVGGPSKEVAMEVAPLRQIPFSPPPSNFSCD